MGVRYISTGFQGLSHELARVAIEAPIVLSVCVGEIAEVVKKNIKATYGDQTKLAALSPFTEAERVALGYSPSDPLLRSGELRDSVHSVHAGLVAEVYSNEPVALYSEVGFVSARSGVSVPPRPAMREGALASETEALDILEAGARVLFRQ